MRASATLGRNRYVRLATPLGVAAVLGLIGSSYLVARASSDLPPRSAAQLMADLQTTQVEHLSGTIIENASLGLPPLAALVTAGRGSAALALLSGSHTVRVWYGNAEQQRLEIVETNGETDVFRDGADLWQWDAGTRTAIHSTVLPAATNPAAQATITPSQLASRTLHAIDPATTVSTLSQRTVAGRAAYQLVLTPRDGRSRVGSVRIAIDGQHHIPVSVQVFARGSNATPVIETAFTSVEFAAPSDATFFAFSPPKGATVEQQGSRSPGDPTSAQADAVEDTTTVGQGWTAVAAVTLPADAATQQARSLLAAALPKVSGTWGSGELFESKLLCALITDTGKVFLGAVDPEVLYAAAG